MHFETKPKTLTVENSGLPPDDIKFLLNVCKSLSFHLNSKFSMDDLVHVLQTLGLNPIPNKVVNLLRHKGVVLEKDVSKESFDFATLCHTWSQLMKDKKEEQHVIRLAFKFFDKDDSGSISKEELMQAMADLGDTLSDEEVDLFLHHFDKDKDGTIQYNEFLDALSSQTNEISQIIRESMDNDKMKLYNL